MQKIVFIVQARMGSTRLPNKSLLYLNGHPVIEWVTTRAMKSRFCNKLIVAIPNTEDNNILYDYLMSKEISTFRGDENNVLSRYVSIANTQGATHIVRICADNPFICPRALDQLVASSLTRKHDYVYNHVPRNNLYPDGLGAEIITYDALMRIDTMATLPEYREHIFNYLLANAEEFSISTLDPSDPQLQHPNLKLDLDTIYDYMFLSRLNASIDSLSVDIVTQALKLSRPEK